MDFSSVITQIAVLIIFGKMLAFGFVNQDERKCRYSRVTKLLKIRCFDMNLKEVPQYLKTSVEILDLSFNRIGKLQRSSFERYGDIKYLLLYENKVQIVEPGTFEHLTSLEEIDLSSNSLITIPLEIFQLPSLRNLYVDSNSLINLENDLQALEKPVQAPLEYLNIADCYLDDLPDLGVLPKLKHINASTNDLSELKIDRLANLCNLNSIDLTNTRISQCQCQQINHHFRYLEIDMKYVPVCVDTLDNSVCPLPFNHTVHSETFKRCKRIENTAEARSKWIFASGCVGGVLLVVLLVWYCIHRRRKHRARRRKAISNRKNLVISPKNANNHNDNELLRCDNV